MKITLENKKKIDTDKMSDIDAEIYEATNNLLNVCKKYKKTFYARVILDKKKYVGGQSLGKKSKEELEFLLELFNDFTSRVSNGEVLVMRMKK